MIFLYDKLYQHSIKTIKPKYVNWITLKNKLNYHVMHEKISVANYICNAIICEDQRVKLLFIFLQLFTRSIDFQLLDIFFVML